MATLLPRTGTMPSPGRGRAPARLEQLEHEVAEGRHLARRVLRSGRDDVEVPGRALVARDDADERPRDDVRLGDEPGEEPDARPGAHRVADEEQVVAHDARRPVARRARARHPE